MMNRQDTVQKDNQPSLIEDLAINNEHAAEVKGGDGVGNRGHLIVGIDNVIVR